MKASRLLDRVILHKWIEAEPLQELPESLNLSEKYSHLAPEQIELIKENLKCEASFFMKGKYPTTIRSNNPVIIDVGNHAPRLSGYRRLNTEEQRVVDEYVAKLIEADVVEPCKSPWSSPILLVPKKDGGLRAVADLRKLNDCVIRDGFHMPDVNESLDQLARSTRSKLCLLATTFSGKLK